MRLLHTQTLELGEFLENATPAYAILSHTWEQEEVTYQDMQGPNTKQKAGYIKIQRCCEQAARDGYEYVWIDTCCIDKSSSAELSEAINSMYVWYKNAKTCYAYLADVEPAVKTQSSTWPNSFRLSRWFTRGWTLQELIAPAKVEFYAKDWSPFGTKAELHLALSEITGIDEATLTGGRDLREVSIAKRMSWASKRVTTRVEDIAYCLIGIFGVNLPLLYGEGERAFVRLQEEIMRSSDDQSLFAWGLTTQEYKSLHETRVGDDGASEPKSTLWGFLARSPAAFEKSGNIVPYRNWEVSMPYSMTNQGLRLELPVIQHEGFKEYTAILACHFEDNYLGPLGVYISPVASPNGDQFARDVWYVNPVLIIPQHASQAKLRTIYIRQEVLLPTVRDFDRRDHFLIRTLPDDPDEEYSLHEVYPTESWNGSQKIIRVQDTGTDREGALIFRKKDNIQKLFAVLVRAQVPEEGPESAEYQCGCSIVVLSSLPKREVWPKLFHMNGVATELFNLCGIEKTSESTYSYIDLNPEDDLSKERETAFVKIGREVFLGQAMFVVDIGVWSSRLKKAPFFANADARSRS
jgi:hypothetical protein